MARKRDSRGRYIKGCSYSRNYKTKRCRSKIEHERSREKLKRRGKTRAMKTITGAVSSLKKKARFDDRGMAVSGYDAFSTPKKLTSSKEKQLAATPIPYSPYQEYDDEGLALNGYTPFNG